MDVTVISDLHGCKPALHGGDLLIVAGDLTARDTADQWAEYFLWQGDQDYRKIIFIGGNHDGRLQEVDMVFYSPEHKVDYLCDSGTEFEGLKIWGSPWTKTFPGMNPHCMAFTCETEEELAIKFSLIPEDIDILITHSPPFGILDETIKAESVGSTELLKVSVAIKPKIHVFGHIHEAYGKNEVIWYNDTIKMYDRHTKYINASHVNEYYRPVNKPIRIEL
jgi:Icc-related predicted phosphoesterase